MPPGRPLVVTSAEAGLGLSRVPVHILTGKHNQSPYMGFHVTWPVHSWVTVPGQTASEN